MHRTIVTDDLVVWYVCKSVRNAPEPYKSQTHIEVLLRVETSGGQRKTVLDGDPDFLHRFDAAFAKLLWLLV